MITKTNAAHVPSARKQIEAVLRRAVHVEPRQFRARKLVHWNHHVCAIGGNAHTNGIVPLERAESVRKFVV